MTRTTRAARTLALAGVILAAAASAHAQESSPAAANSPAPKPASDGFWIQSEGGDFRLRVGGYLQGDGRFFLDDQEKLGTDSFLLRRVRPQLRGTLARRFDFYVMTDFGGGAASLQDAFVEARFAPYLRIRAGKTKSPLGLERLQSGSNLLFLERALPTSLLPNRDVGLQLQGEAADGIAAWTLALENGTADGGSADGDANDGKDLAARVFARPFKRSRGPLRGLGLGVSGQTGRQHGASPAAYKTPGQQSFFSYVPGVAIEGTRRRLSPQGHLYLGPFGLLGEYALSSFPLVQEDPQDPARTVRGRVRNTAWQAAASLFVTGEKAGFSAVQPARPFDPGQGRWGALELAARVHQLSIDARAFDLGFADSRKAARRATAWAVGVNWHLDRHVTYALNYEQTSFEGGAAAGDRPTERALLVRAQVLF